MRGISHKELLKIDPWQYDNQQDLLNHILEQCKELNPWLPIENAPKDRPVFLWNGKSKCIGYWFKDEWLIICWLGVDHSLNFISYQELPDDPEKQGSLQDESQKSIDHAETTKLIDFICCANHHPDEGDGGNLILLFKPSKNTRLVITISGEAYFDVHDNELHLWFWKPVKYKDIEHLLKIQTNLMVN